MVGSEPPLVTGFLCSGLPYHLIEGSCTKAGHEAHQTAEKQTCQLQVTSSRLECNPAAIETPEGGTLAYPRHHVTSISRGYPLEASYALGARWGDDGVADRGDETATSRRCDGSGRAR